MYSGSKTQKVMQQFTDITKRALNQFVNERINERLKSALGPDSPTVEASRSIQPTASASALAPAELTASEEAKVVTTDDEREGFMIVRAILSGRRCLATTRSSAWRWARVP